MGYGACLPQAATSKPAPLLWETPMPMGQPSPGADSPTGRAAQPYGGWPEQGAWPECAQSCSSLGLWLRRCSASPRAPLGARPPLPPSAWHASSLSKYSLDGVGCIIDRPVIYLYFHSSDKQLGLSLLNIACPPVSVRAPRGTEQAEGAWASAQPGDTLGNEPFRTPTHPAPGLLSCLVAVAGCVARASPGTHVSMRSGSPCFPHANKSKRKATCWERCRR